nr:hypothetical protein [Tanacetum cinerariifolium]
MDEKRQRAQEKKEDQKEEREKKQRLLFLVVAQEHRTCSSDLKKDLETPKGRVYAKRKMGTRLRVKGIYLNQRRQPENGDLPIYDPTKAASPAPIIAPGTSLETPSPGPSDAVASDEATIEELAQYEDDGWNDAVIPEEKERLKQLKEYMKVIIGDFMQLSLEVTRRLKDNTREEGGRLRKIEKITKYPDKEKSLISMGVVMELHNRGCFWPIARETMEEDEEDDEGAEAARGDAGHEGAGGSADMYHNMS